METLTLDSKHRQNNMPTYVLRFYEGLWVQCLPGASPSLWPGWLHLLLVSCSFLTFESAYVSHLFHSWNLNQKLFKNGNPARYFFPAKPMLLFHVFSLLLCLRRFYRKLPKSNCGGSLFKVHRCTHVTRVPLNKIKYIIASDSYPKSHCILGLYWLTDVST